MSKDLGDAIGTAIGKAAREAAESVRSGAKSGDGLSGMKGVVAGAGLATLAPLAVKGAGKLVSKVPSVAFLQSRGHVSPVFSAGIACSGRPISSRRICDRFLASAREIWTLRIPCR
jgi:hypothetical protein